eukprot:TRINITY_DN6678_c0_g1_i1.p1 TRINITY_DN6678_c0_g1~~TRINITY_DN6678_c0_g1_i1.p1  ORF type:complete len:361 (+),score=80.88 TRINITY_DN6678_c0_g1_i1:1-1083(+)
MCVNEFSIPFYLHHAGINLRFIGKILSLLSVEYPVDAPNREDSIVFWKKNFVIEMLARSFKTIVNASMRQQMEIGGKETIVEEKFNTLLVELLNLVFSGDDQIWKVLIYVMSKKFKFDPSQTMMSRIGYSLSSQNFDRILLFNAITRVLGLQWREDVVSQLKSTEAFTGNFPRDCFEEQSDRNVKLKEMGIAKYVKGKALLSKALSIVPADSYESELRMSNIASAIQCLKEALNSCPSDRNTLLLLGDAFLMKAVSANSQEYIFANHCYRLAIAETAEGFDDSEPVNCECYLKLALMFWKKGEIENAEYNFQLAFKSNPKSPKVLCFYADFLFNFKPYLEEIIISFYEKAIEFGRDYKVF